MSRWIIIASTFFFLSGAPSALACILVDENGNAIPDGVESSDSSTLAIATVAAFAAGGAGGALATKTLQRKRDK